MMPTVIGISFAIAWTLIAKINRHQSSILFVIRTPKLVIEAAGWDPCPCPKKQKPEDKTLIRAWIPNSCRNSKKFMFGMTVRR